MSNLEIPKGEAGDSMAFVELLESLKAEKTTIEETLQAEKDGKMLNPEDVAVERQNQQDPKRIIDDLRNKIEQKAANSKLQNTIDEISMTIRNTNLEANGWKEALKTKEADKCMRPTYASQTLSAPNVLHDIEETETLISRPPSLLPEPQDQSQLEAQKSELEREFKELQEQSHQSQKEIDYLCRCRNELIRMIETAKTAHKKKEEGIKRDILNCEEERRVIERCIATSLERMLILEEECWEVKETAEPMIYSMNDGALRMKSELVERFRNIEIRLSDCINKLQTEKANLARNHENEGLAMELTILDLLKERQELIADLYDEEIINKILAIFCTRNDDSKVREKGVGDVVASDDIRQSEESEKTTDTEILQTLKDEKALNLEDVTITSEKQQGFRKIMDVLISEKRRVESENVGLQIGIDMMSGMVIDTNLEVDNLKNDLKDMEWAGELIRAASALQSLSAQEVLQETEAAEALVSLFQEQQDQSQLGGQNSDLEEGVQEMRKQSSLNEREIDKLRANGNALIEMIESAKTAHGKKIEGTWRDIQNCKQECEVQKECIQRWSDRAGTLEEEFRQMKEITMPIIHSMNDALLRLKLEVEERFRNMQMRLSACREELQEQNARLMTVDHENQEYTTMNHKMKSVLQDVGTVCPEMLEEMEKSGKELHDMERVKKMEDVAKNEKMLNELKMRKNDLKKEILDLKTQKQETMVLLSLQYEHFVEECRKLCQLIHDSQSKWERLRHMFW